MKKHHSAFVGIFLALMVALLVPTLAFAATHDGSGSGSGGGGGGGGGNWNFDGKDKLRWWDDDGGYTSYDNYAPYGNYQGHWNLPKHTRGCYIGATSSNSELWNYGWINFDWLFDRPNYCTYYASGAGSEIAKLPAWAEEEANKNGYYLGGGSKGDGLWYNSSTGKYLDAIYEEGGTWKPDEWYHWKDVIVYQEEGTPGNMHTTIDCRNWSSEDKYNKAPTSSEYSHITQPKNTTETYYVHTIVQTIKKTEWWWEYPDGSWDSWYLDYDVENNNEYSKTIYYGATTPELAQEYYCPLNINRQGYAQVGDNGITNNYINGKKIDATVTNAQNRSGNSAIETLDLNADTKFSITFNNDVLGLDASKDWNNKPPDLNNGDWENVIGGSYANGRMPSGGDYYRYNLTFNAAISTNASKSLDTASIVVNGHEYTASETYKAYTWQSPIRTINASARFIYIGNYKLKSGIQGAKLPDWWTASYSTGTFFEYGVGFRGTISTSGISAPSVIQGQADMSQNGDDYYLKTNYDKRQRGLYVGAKRQDFLQPLVCADFNVKTVAGDLRR